MTQDEKIEYISRLKSPSSVQSNYEKYGNSKIYKAKKRLELRLKSKNLYDDGFLIAIPTEVPTKEDIYQLI